MATAEENALKVLTSIEAKLNLDKFPRGTFIEGFGDDLAYIRYNGCIEARFSSGKLTDEEAEEQAQKIIDTCGTPKLNTSEDFLAPEDFPHCMSGDPHDKQEPWFHAVQWLKGKMHDIFNS